MLAGDSSAAPIEVSLVWGGGAIRTRYGDGRQTHYDLRKNTAAAYRRGNTDNGRLEIVGKGTGSFLVGTVSLMPADNIQGWRPTRWLC